MALNIEFGTVYVEEISGGSITLANHQLNVPYLTATYLNFDAFYNRGTLGGALGLANPGAKSQFPFLMHQAGLDLPANIITMDLTNKNLIMGGLPPIINSPNYAQAVDYIPVSMTNWSATANIVSAYELVY